MHTHCRRKNSNCQYWRTEYYFMMADEKSLEDIAPGPPDAEVLAVHTSALATLQLQRGLDAEILTHRSYLDIPQQRVEDIAKQLDLDEREARIFSLGLRTGMLGLARALNLPKDTE